MPALNISPSFTVEDIHKVRAYRYELTKEMTAAERRTFYKDRADDAEERIFEFRKQHFLMSNL